jgi:S-sulfo-L-cysteine synthase (3-phospho-L-serine-dependent)
MTVMSAMRCEDREVFLRRSEMNQPWLVFIESNTSGTGRLFTAAARRKGYFPVVLTDTPSRYSYLAEDDVKTVVVQTQDLEALRETIAHLSVKAPVAGIFSTSEYYMETAAALAKDFGLPGADAGSIANCRNKWIQRQRLRQIHLRTPVFHRVCSAREACDAAEAIGLPVIVKPTLGTGSVGVRLCKTNPEVYEHASLLLGQTANERGIRIPKEVLVEEYLIGPEFSVETFNSQLIGATRKYVSREPYFVEIGHDFPAELSSEVMLEVITVVSRALEGLGLTWGPAHTEMRLTGKGPTIIEINPRLAGGFIPEIVRLASGIDLIEETLKIVTSAEPDLGWRSRFFASIRFLFCREDGIITGLQGLEEATGVPGVTDIQLYRSIGDRCNTQYDFRDRIGHVITQATSMSAASDAAQTALNKIFIGVAPPSSVETQSKSAEIA